MRSLLVTGGAGFVGAHLALASKRARPASRVVALDNLCRRGSERNLERLAAGGVEFVHGDVRCRTDLEAIAGDFELIVDAAADPSVTAGLGGSPESLVATNLLGTVHTLELARARGSAFVLLSSSRVYSLEALRALPLVAEDSRYALAAGALPAGASARGIGEGFSTAGARSFYGATKLASELLVEEYAAHHGVRAVVNRCGVIAGPGQFGRADQGVFSLWLARHLDGGPLAYTGFEGSGRQVRDLLHPDDLFELLERQWGDVSAWCGQVYNVGGGLSGAVSLREWTQVCAEATGCSRAVASRPESHPVDVAYYVSDTARAEARFGWKPARGPRQIADDLTRWLRAGGPA